MDSCGSIGWIGSNGEHGTIGESIRISCIKITGCESSLMNPLVSPETTDASSMELTDRLMVTSEDEFRSSVTDTWNESEPKKFGLGEYVQFPSVGWIVADP